MDLGLVTLGLVVLGLVTLGLVVLGLVVLGLVSLGHVPTYPGMFVLPESVQGLSFDQPDLARPSGKQSF